MKRNPIQNPCIQFLSILTLIVIGLNSCCSKKGCVGADQMDFAYLKNFEASEIDSISMVTYKKGTDFKTVIDSFMIEQCDTMGNDMCYMGFNGKMIQTSNDYAFYFTKINKVYRINGFKTGRAECNDCFFPDYYTRLEGYEINGKWKETGFMEIDRDAD